jgi:hypothetical protein
MTYFGCFVAGTRKPRTDGTFTDFHRSKSWATVRERSRGSPRFAVKVGRLLPPAMILGTQR